MSGKQLLHRIFILLFSLIMLLSCFSGCAYGTDSLTKPQPAVHTPEGTEVTLHVLTEVSADPGMMSDLIKEIAEKYSEEHENVSIEIEFLPDKDHLEERSIRLEQLKTEILAGRGPDIYLLPTTVYTLEMLFNDLELSMRNGMFHEISAYYDSDDELNKEELNTAVMDAGTYGKARYILPLRYDFPVLLVDEEKLQDYGLTLDDIRTTEKLMNTILETQNTLLANSAFLGSLQLDYFFPEFVDYNNNEVLVTSDEVAVFMRQYQTLQNLSGEYALSGNVERTAPAHMSTYMITGSYWTMGEYPFNIENLSSVLQSKVIAKSLGAEFDMYPLYSADGSLIAHIRYWGAIGGNCEYPDVAYDFLREFLTRDAQWELNRDSLLITFASDYYENGIPVRNKGALLPMIQCVMKQTTMEYSENEKEARRLALQTVTLEESDIPVWDAEIDQVRFEMPMCDAFFFEMTAALNDRSFGKPYIPTDVDIDEIAKEFVTELRYLLAEG